MISILQTATIYLAPFLTCVSVLMRCGCPSLPQFAAVVPFAVVLIGGPMSVCLHRYFAHAAFKTSRGMQFVLGIVACLAYQRGPLWWASKHKRHHKHCDEEKDPHSWTQAALKHGESRGYLYAWIGWTFTAKEAHTDWQYISKLQSSLPELLMLEWLWLVPPVFLNIMLYNSLGAVWMACMYTAPMLLCNLITLLFNVEYHPMHRPTEENCKAADNARFLSELVGESYHSDHHVFPRKAHRPGLDLPFWLIIRPLEATGLVWDARPN